MEQEMLNQILEGINEIKEDVKRLDKKIDATVNKSEKRLIKEINLQGRYITVFKPSRI